ncbi:Disease resistance protein RPP8 [Abeliophyllum distichum]|uniref:Disease resistance protein RPP8 n=1 Tax=Abeliophyllum distichum TaxID=126358 RepID=A0ABD1RZJ8_9LAMI
MRFLNVQESWNLLHEMVFGEEHCLPKLKKRGKTISMECMEIPLLLVARNIGSVIAGRYFGILASISFIYNQLPYHFRACFLDMGVLPEDYEIRRSKLTKLWVANRFIKLDRSRSLEEVAEENLKYLVDRNLILVREWNYSGEIKTCSIHDSLREFCPMKAKEEKFNSDVEYLPEFHDNLLQVSILTDLKNKIPKFALTHDRDLHVCAVIFFIHNNPNDVHFIINFRLLRVLDALTIRFQKFPVEIVELVIRP